MAQADLGVFTGGRGFLQGGEGGFADLFQGSGGRLPPLELLVAELVDQDRDPFGRCLLIRTAGQDAGRDAHADRRTQQRVRPHGSLRGTIVESPTPLAAGHIPSGRPGQEQ